MLGTLPGERINDRAWRGTLARCGLHDEALVALVSRTFREQERRVARLFPDALPALEALRAAGHRVGLITNGAAVLQRDKVAAVGLDGVLDPVVISSEVGVAKPDRGVFDAAIALGGFQAATTWFVGDNLGVDVLGARRAGLVPVWINRTGRARPEEAPEPDHEVTALTALPGLLAQAPR
jgi:putative hydrolase of the HAD superfamily